VSTVEQAKMRCETGITQQGGLPWKYRMFGDDCQINGQGCPENKKIKEDRDAGL